MKYHDLSDLNLNDLEMAFKVNGKLFLAHLWGDYAIPLALSVFRRPSSIVRRVSSVSTITTRNN